MEGSKISGFWSRAWLLAGLMALLAAAGCGGGGGGGSETSSDGVSAGRVAVYLTGGGAAGLARQSPSGGGVSLNEYAQALVTIAGVELLGSGGAVPLYEGPPRVVDLLDLGAASFLLCLRDVPAGTYDKIRLTATALTLVDGEGVEESVDLVANGKIDLNPRGPITVLPGQTLVVELDGENSLHLVETGNGKLRFRPEVFVSVRPVPLPSTEGRLVRLHGTVTALFAGVDGAEPAGRWLLLDTSSGRDASASCVVKVELGPDASFFDQDELEIAFADLAVGDETTIVGRFVRPDAIEGEDPLPLLKGDLVERGTFRRLTGTVLTSPTSAPGTFLFRLDPGQGLRGDLVVDAHVYAGSKVYGPTGEPATLGDLAIWPDLPPVRARLDAVLDLSDARPDVAHVAMIVLEDRPAPCVRASGAVVAFDEAGGALTLLLPSTVDGGAEREVTFLVGEGTHFYRFAAGPALDPAEPGDVVPGGSVLVFGRRDDAGQVLLDDVFLWSLPPA